jgi:hypothetical protein
MGIRHEVDARFLLFIIGSASGKRNLFDAPIYRISIARPTTMVSNDPIRDYMQRHACSFPEALEALAAQLGLPTAQDIRRALQTLGRAGAQADLLEALEIWSDDQIQ